jgi:hypothetical protein
MALTKEQLETLKGIQLRRNSVATSTPAAQPSIGGMAQAEPERGFFDKAKDFVGGAAYGFSAPGRTIQNMMSKGVDALAGTQGFGAATKQGFEQSTGTDVDTTSGKVGQFAGEVIPYLAQPGAAAIKGATGFLGRAAMDTAIGTAQTGDLGQGTTIGVGGQVLSLGGKALQQFGRGLYKATIPLSKGEAKAVINYKANKPFVERIKDLAKGQSTAPVTTGETAFSKGLKGTEPMLAIQAKQAQNTLWKQTIEPALKNSQTKVDMQEFFGEVQESIVKNNADLTRQKSLLNALEAIKEDYAGVDIVDITQLQKYKSGWAKFVPDKAYRGQDIAGSVKEVQNELAKMSRQKIYDAVDDPAVKRAYIDYGNLNGLSEWGTNALAGSRIKGGTGTTLDALRNMVLVPIGTIGGRTIYRTGNGIEYVGAAGAKTVNDILNESDAS